MEHVKCRITLAAKSIEIDVAASWALKTRPVAYLMMSIDPSWRYRERNKRIAVKPGTEKPGNVVVAGIVARMSLGVASL